MVAWLPFALLFTRNVVQRRSWGWVAAAGLAVYLMISAGHHPTLLHAMTLTAIWCIFWLAERERWFADIRASRHWRDALPIIRHDVPRLAGSFAVGLLLAAPLLIHSMELSRRSIRAGISYGQATEYSAQPITLIQLILPKLFGSNPNDYWGSFAHGENWNYVGIATLILAGLAVAMRPRPTRLLWAGIAGVALLYALGPATTLHGWVWRFVPFFDLIRAPARAYLWLDLSLAVLSGFAIHDLSRLHGRLPRRARSLVNVVRRGALVVLAAVTLFVLPLFYSLVLNSVEIYNRPVIAIDNLVMFVLFLTLTIGLLSLVVLRQRRGVLFACLAMAVIVLDLFSVTAPFNPTTDDILAGYRHGPELEFMARHAPHRTAVPS